MLVQEPIQKFQVIQDRFSPSEAKEVVCSMIDPYIQYYKLQYMRNWEGDHEFDSSSIDKKIDMLNAMKGELENSINRADSEGFMLNLEGLLDLKLTR